MRLWIFTSSRFCPSTVNSVFPFFMPFLMNFKILSDILYILEILLSKIAEPYHRLFFFFVYLRMYWSIYIVAYCRECTDLYIYCNGCLSMAKEPSHCLPKPRVRTDWFMPFIQLIVPLCSTRLKASEWLWSERKIISVGFSTLFTASFFHVRLHALLWF